MKKKLLAGLLSFTMLTGQMLPVVAADDADVTVSEDAVIAEEAEEATVDTQEAEDVVGHIEIELGEDDEEIVLGEGEEIRYEVASAEEFAAYLESEDIVVDEETLDAVGKHIYVGNNVSGIIVADPVVINGETYNLTANYTYDSVISYRGRNIKADSDLHATATSASLEKLALDLGASNTAGLITAKFSAKKNKKANSGSYFTVKFSVNKTVAKSVGLKGKALKNFNKGLKKLNKAAKKTHIEFMISPIDTADIEFKSDWVPIVTIYTRWGIEISRKFSHIRLRTENSMPEYSKTRGWEGWKKWTKLSNKEFTKSTQTINGVNCIILTPKGKNLTGGPIGFEK